MSISAVINALELVVVVCLTGLWMMYAPFMAILAVVVGEWVNRDSTPGISMFTSFWLVGGLVGIWALWAVLLPSRASTIQQRPVLCVTGLLVGIAVSLSVFLPWRAGWLHFQLPPWEPYALLIPAVVAVRHLAAMLLNRVRRG